MRPRHPFGGYIASQTCDGAAFQRNNDALKRQPTGPLLQLKWPLGPPSGGGVVFGCSVSDSLLVMTRGVRQTLREAVSTLKVSSGGKARSLFISRRPMSCINQTEQGS
jgi:hypothetical protein